VDNSHDGIFLANSSIQVVYANKELCGILQLQHNKIISRSLKDFIDSKDIKAVLDALNELIKNNMPVHIIFKIVREDGELRNIKLNSSLIKNSQGNILIIGQMLDVTEKEKLEEEFLKIKKLESVGLFAGGIAHDFNNILNAILGNISLAKLSFEDKNELSTLLEAAEKASVRAKNLTNQLLTFSKGGAPIKKSMKIEKLLYEAVNLALSGSNLKCIYTIDNELWPVEVDEGQLHQVISNIVLNSKQAMPSGGNIELVADNISMERVSILPFLKKGNYVKISIKDNGIGIPDDIINKIFDPYFTTKTTGQGLGLTSVYSIIKKHEGHITAESISGKGTTFTIFLPASEIFEEIITLNSESIDDIKKGFVLLMDDEESILSVTTRMLEKLGFTVIQARDGKEAISICKKYSDENKLFDFAIFDLTIPGGIGGKEALKDVLKIYPDLKVIVSSGYSNDPVMANFQEYGFKEVIAKPYTIDDLKRIIKKFIE
jgi:PAS domain S-box-containing protein